MSALLGIVLIWLSASILWWCGWKKEVAEGIPDWAVRIYLLGWPITLFWQFSLTEEITVQGIWIWTCIAFVVLAVRINSVRRWTTLSVGVLLGTTFLLLSRLSIYPSTLSYLLAPWGMSIIVGWLSATLLRDASEQFIAITTSLLLNDAIAVGFMPPLTWFTLGEPASMEVWWIALIFARLWTVTSLEMLIKIRKLGVRSIRKRGGQRL